MSLINKMLKDLEKRDAFINQNSDDVLDGLYSAYDIELKTKKNSYQLLFFIIMFLSVLIFSLVYYDSIENKLISYLSIDKNEINIQERIVNSNMDQTIEVISEVSKIISSSEPSDEYQPGFTVNEEKKYSFDSLKLEETILLSELDILNEEKNRIDSIHFEIDDAGINLIMKTPNEVDYLVYGLNNPERIVIEVKNVELGFKLEELEPIEPIVAIRYSINEANRFKLVLESEHPLFIHKSVTTKSGDKNDLIVMMDYEWGKTNSVLKEKEEIATIVEQQVEQEKDVVFKGDLIKIPVNNNTDNYSEKLFQDAFLAYKKGDTSDSLKKLNIVLNHEPGHTKARSTLALALSEKDHYELAYSVLNEGLIQYPENTEWLKVYARLLLNQDKIIEASNILEKQTPELAYNTDYYALYGAVLQKLNKHSDAAKLYRDLLHVNPLKAVWWLGLGISLESLKRYDDALYAYQKASNDKALANDSRQFILKRITHISNILVDESS